MESTRHYRFRFPRPLPYLIAGAVFLTGVVWLAAQILPPHSVSSVVELESDSSTAVRDSRPRNFLLVHPFEGATSPLWGLLLGDEVAERLGSIYPDVSIDSEFVLEGASFDADRDKHRIKITFTDDRRDLAETAVLVILAEYEVALEMAEHVAADRGVLHWDIISVGALEARSPNLAVLFLLLGSAAGVAFLIPRRWWADRIVWDDLSLEDQWIIAGGMIGLAVVLTPDLIGYGYSGFGPLQWIGTVLSVTAIVIATETRPTPISSDPTVLAKTPGPQE